jgi:hypothetical protein
MAGDLIPPPSPAGRPEPDSSEKLQRPWAGVEATPPPPAPEPPAPVAAEPVETPYRPRFGFILGALIGIALGVIGLGVILAVSTSSDDGVPEGWSAWTPTADDKVAIAKQIAEHVGPKYRLGDGNQLVAVAASDFEVSEPPVPFRVAIRSAPVGGDIELLEGNGVLYTLNGLARQGSIPGDPSPERGLLVRREALELALYTFRYAEDVDMVVTLLPPVRTEKPKGDEPAPQPQIQAVLFRPGDLKDRLEAPLVATIPPQTPRPETFDLDALEARNISALTTSNEFVATFQQGQDAMAYLVLDRAEN